MQDELLQLMMKFKLCYQIPGSQESYITPQLLTENQPAYEWPESNNLHLRYTYDFMPKGILTQFIVATHSMIADLRYVWKSGVILKKDQAAAEVIEHYGKREVTIRVVGKRKKELLTIVTYELDKIHDSYRRLKYDKLILCNCSHCKISPVPHFYRFEILRKFANDRQRQIQCQHSYQMVEVLSLIDDVMDRTQLFRNVRDFEVVQPDYDLKRIRTLLIEGFSEAELSQFCYDEAAFRPVYTELAQISGLAAVADRLLKFAKRRVLIETLLDWAKATNPAKYTDLQPYF